MSIHGNYVPSMVQWWCWMICLGVLCPLSSWVPLNGLERNPKSFEMNCNVSYCSFPLWIVLKEVIVTKYDVQTWDGLEMSLKYSVCGLSCMKQFQKGCLPWRMKHYIIQWNGPKRSQFLMISPCDPVMVLKEANFVGMYNGLEISQLLPYRWWSWK